MLTSAITSDIQHHVNEDEKQAYNIVISQTPTGANDVFLYVKNTSEDNLWVASIFLRSASAESVNFVLGDTGTPAGGATYTPVNKNAGSANLATGTFQTGNNITGLSGGSTVDTIFAGTTTEHYHWESGLILPKNQIFTLYAVTGAVAINMTVNIFYHSNR